MIYDFIVVGHGLAGAILAETLRSRGNKVLVIDEPKANSASRVAAGLLNPVAGKRFAKSWLADMFVPAADAFYDALESRFGKELFFHKPIYKIFSTIEEQNTWMAKSAGDAFNDYISATYTQTINQPGIEDPFGGIMIEKGGFLHVYEMLDLLTEDLLQQNLMLPERFEMKELELTEEGVNYKTIKAKHLVFCEGYQVIHNPYFAWLPLQPTKGEVLEVQTEQNFSPECIYNKGVYVVPEGAGRFIIGATYDWRNPDEEITELAAGELSEKFRQITTKEFEVTGHWAGIRPAVRDRKPLAGTHPNYKQLSVFNGMGSKGVLMAPYLSQHFADALAGQTELMPDIHISRYFSLYYDYIKHQNLQL
ncbi:FAD-dependent oxidoreductase [Pontibacter sp. BT310]|uniref:FAD-binding oxidoreductase n=1 Tax=Pontibacter populi TaxID=890055 RepID=A0ABS6XEM3_9BACT|nr:MULTISPECIES: FAD-dependent oxidoreductase [Pontibacter]MBJ6119590.1 FAD-dependent oxidoreductase [Pontibacter sp. BT310]MBR0572017.1 FAD-dependent oxidoreductase [Microvirga sp. STS03]MBW3366443.1 FAD-binding oxidoreductase [Pontibacter populi]